jgi:hypothetical protein
MKLQSERRAMPVQTHHHHHVYKDPPDLDEPAKSGSNKSGTRLLFWVILPTVSTCGSHAISDSCMASLSQES